MEAVSLLLSLIGEVAPAISTSATIAKVISGLSSLVPTLVQEYKDLVPVAKNVIAALRGNSATTPDQLSALDDLEARIDAEFEAAATAAEAEDAAAEGKP